MKRHKESGKELREVLRNQEENMKELLVLDRGLWAVDTALQLIVR